MSCNNSLWLFFLFSKRGIKLIDKLFSSFTFQLFILIINKISHLKLWKGFYIQKSPLGKLITLNLKPLPLIYSIWKLYIPWIHFLSLYDEKIFKIHSNQTAFIKENFYRLFLKNLELKKWFHNHLFMDY